MELFFESYILLIGALIVVEVGNLGNHSCGDTL